MGLTLFVFYIDMLTFPHGIMAMAGNETFDDSKGQQTGEVCFGGSNLIISPCPGDPLGFVDGPGPAVPGDPEKS